MSNRKTFVSKQSLILFGMAFLFLVFLIYILIVNVQEGNLSLKGLKIEPKVEQKTEKITPQASEKIELSERAEEFTISTSQEKHPKFLKVIFDPFKAKGGEYQRLIVALEDASLITNVYAKVQDEIGERKLELTLIKEEDIKTTWQGEWLIKLTEKKEYPIVFIAENENGEKNELTLFWQAEKGGTLKEQSLKDKIKYRFTKIKRRFSNKISEFVESFAIFAGWMNESYCNSADDFPHAGSCTVNKSFSISQPITGIDNGNLTIQSGKTIQLNSGVTFVFNQNYNIAPKGSIALASNAKIVKGYLWIKDVDSDGCGRNPNNSGNVTYTSSTSSPGSGWRRVKDVKYWKDPDDNNPGNASNPPDSCNPPKWKVGEVCNRGSWQCDGYCRKKREIYTYDSNCNCVFDHWQYSNCPKDTVCSGGNCVNNQACSTSGYQCKDQCTRGQKQYRCNGSNKCNQFWRWINTSSCNPFKCSGGSCSNVCKSSCGADSACDGKSPGSSCDSGKKCNSNCKCVSVCTGSLSCKSSTQNSITLKYSFSNCGNIYLFKGGSYVAYLGNGTKSNATYTVSGLSPDTSYTFYLSKSSSRYSPYIASATCSTQAAQIPINLPLCPFTDTEGVWVTANWEGDWNQRTPPCAGDPCTHNPYARCRLGENCSCWPRVWIGFIPTCHGYETKTYGPNYTFESSTDTHYSRRAKFCRTANASAASLPKCQFSGTVGDIYITPTGSVYEGSWTNWANDKNKWCKLSSSGYCNHDFGWGDVQVETWSGYQGTCWQPCGVLGLIYVEKCSVPCQVCVVR